MEKWKTKMVLRFIFRLLALGMIILFQDTAVWSADSLKPARAQIDWDAIRVLDLETATRIAFSDNPSLKAAQMRVKQARERVKQTRAAYFPRLDLKASAARVRLSENAHQSMMQYGQENPEDRYQTGIAASWLLFDGFERHFNNTSAEMSLLAHREAEKDALRLLASALAGVYFQALLARENVVILKADEKFNQRQLEDAKARLNAGTGSLSDVLNFKVQLNAGRSERNQAALDYDNAIYMLAALMGLDHSLAPADGLPSHVKLESLETKDAQTLTETDAQSLIGYALEHRPDITQRKYALKRAKSNFGAARARFYPNLNLAATLDGERNQDASFQDDDFGDALTLNLSYNLFAGGADRARVAETRWSIKEAQKNLLDLQHQIVSEVREALAGLKAAHAELRLQRANAGLVKQNRDLVEKEYAAGESSLVRLNEAQRDLIKALGRLALARVGLRRAGHNLKVSTAEILEEF